MLAAKPSVWPLDKIIPYPNNPRTHPAEQITLLAKLFVKHGIDQPIVVDEDGFILKGHGRRMAAVEAGMKSFPVVQHKGLSEGDKRAIRLADNQVALLSGWDSSLLKLELTSLKATGFEMELLGFSDVALVSFMAGVPHGSDREKAPELPQVATTKLGDVWVLGRHRVICGDCTDADVIERVMAGERAELVFTDPPYRMAAEGGSLQPVGRAAARLGEAIKHLTDFDPPEFLEALPTVFPAGVMNAYVFCNKDLLPDYLNWAVENGYAFNVLFWKKPMAIPLGGQHRPDVEYIVFFRKKGIWNNAVENANYSKCLEHGREDSTIHPTMKPVTLIENQLLISSRVNSVVVDFFCGSGSTIIASEILGRRCRTMELWPGYVDVAVLRWQAFSKQEAVLEGDGRTFAEVAKARAKRAPAATRKAPSRKARGLNGAGVDQAAR